MIKRIIRWFLADCPEGCGGKIRHIGSDWTGRVWLEVYECDKCKKEFV